MYIYIHNSHLLSQLSQSDILYISFKFILQSFCLLPSEIACLFFLKLDNNSPGSAVSELCAISESLSDIVTLSKGGTALQKVNYTIEMYVNAASCT